MAELALYYRPSCPYCQKVLKFMQEEKIDLELRDISLEESHRQELVRAGGKQQVPCLFVNGSPMYESGDIVDFLGKNKA